MEPKNLILRAYYLEKSKTKQKMAVLGTIIHKICNVVFTISWDEKLFVLISPQEHCQKFLHKATESQPDENYP